jgi:hypothetical protein
VSLSSGPFRRLWERRKHGAFPAGAVTFHLGAWTKRNVTSEADATSAEVMALYGFEELLVVHGSAWSDEGGCTLVSGPPGIGKSTVLRTLERSGLGRFVEDGLLLVGLRAGRWHLLVTGTLAVLDRTSRIGARVRSLVGVRFCLHQNEDSELLRRAHPFRASVLSLLPYASFTLATALGPRDGRPFKPATHEVRTLVVMPHPEDPAHALRLRRGVPAEKVIDLALLAPAAVSVVRVSPIGDLGEVRARLRGAVLSARDREPHGPLGA